MAKTKIAWTDFSWPVINGCLAKSAGCKGCYAARLAATRLKHTERYRGLAVYGEHGAHWTGDSRLDVKELEKPLRWRKPRRIFVCEMGDLFYERNTNEQIAAVFGVMAACPQHCFQILTKRPERMLEWFRWVSRPDMLEDEPPGSVDPIALCSVSASGAMPGRFRWDRHDGKRPWPLPNVHIGVSCENQAAADERIPLLLQVPAAVRWVSIEPMIGSVDLSRVRIPDAPSAPLTGHSLHEYRGFKNRISWVVVGGESGPNARPCNVEWIRSIVRQCRAAGVATFVKQLGAKHVTEQGFCLSDRGAGSDPSEWPEDLCIREYPR